MSDLISRSEFLEELEKYEKELCKDRIEAIETDDENMLFAIANQLTAICRIKRNIMNMPTAYSVDKVVEDIMEAYGCHDCEQADTMTCNECAELEVLNDICEIVKQGGVSDYVCEWIKYDYRTICPKNHDANNPYWRIPDNTDKLKYCPYCGKKIKVVE